MIEDEEVIDGVMIEPDGEEIELSAEEVRAIIEAAEAAKEAQIIALRALADKLNGKRDAVVRAKRPIEQRWIDDMRQYEGTSRLSDTKGDNHAAATSSAPRIHVTRARTDLWEARLSDMLLPVQDSAWDIALKRDGLARLPIEQQSEVEAQMTGRMNGMKNAIRSQLIDCKFQRSGRRMIRDACRIGTGVVMGPMNGIKRTRSFGGEQGSSVAVVEETLTPEIREADPWFFYPDMVPNAEQAEFAFYLHLMSRREVAELAKYPGFDKDEIRKLLHEEPELGEVGININLRNSSMDTVEPTTGRYAVWRYTGALDPDDLKALELCGCDGEEEDVLDQKMVDIWFCQNKVLKAELAPMEDDFRIPYYVFSPFPADDTMFGYGLPYLCRDSARFADASYRVALHNLSVSSAPMLFLRSGAIKPADGSWVVRGPKTFWVDDHKFGDRPLNDLMSFKITPSVAAEAFSALDKALQIVDLELNAEGWASQEPSTQQETASGLAMIMNTKSIIQRRAAACADDEVFAPMIERMYWWNMDFNEDEFIKGDYEVTTCSQSVLLVKDVQVQHTLAFLQMAYGNEKFAQYVNDYDALVASAKLFDMPNRESLLKTKAQADEEMKNQPPDPQQVYMEAKAKKEEAMANMLTVEAQVKQAKEQRVTQESSIDQEFRQQDREMHHMETEATLEARMTEARVRMQVAIMREETARMEAMDRNQLSSRQLDSKIQANAAANASKERMGGLKAGMDAQEMVLKRQFGTGI